MLDQLDKPTTLAQRVGLNMRKWRLSNRWTLADVAGRCKTTPQTIQRLEMGTMTLSVEWVGEISEALGIKPYILFLDDEVVDNSPAPSLLEIAEKRARKAELAFQMLRAAVDTICREQLD